MCMHARGVFARAPCSQCVMELFVFLQMGGQRDAIVIPVGGPIERHVSAPRRVADGELAGGGRRGAPKGGAEQTRRRKHIDFNGYASVSCGGGR